MGWGRRDKCQGGRSKRPWIWTSQEQGPLYKCMVGIYKIRGGQSPGLGPFLGQGCSESLRRRDTGPGRLSSGSTTAASLSPFHLPSTHHSKLVPGEGPLGAISSGWTGAGRGRAGSDPLRTLQASWITFHPPRAPLAPTQLVSPAFAHKMHPEGALLGRPQSTLQTLVGWEPPSPRGEEGGKGLRTARVGDKPQRPRPIPSSCGPQGRPPLFPQSTFQNGREGRLGCGEGLGMVL